MTLRSSNLSAVFLALAVMLSGLTTSDAVQSRCTAGYYHDSINNRCARCHYSCRVCYGAATTQCSECAGGFWLDDNYAIDSADMDVPSGVVLDASGQTIHCAATEMTVVEADGADIQHGDDGHIFQGPQYCNDNKGICTRCHQSCLACDPATATWDDAAPTVPAHPNANYCTFCKTGFYFESASTYTIEFLHSYQYDVEATLVNFDWSGGGSLTWADVSSEFEYSAAYKLPIIKRSATTCHFCTHIGMVVRSYSTNNGATKVELFAENANCNGCELDCDASELLGTSTYCADHLCNCLGVGFGGITAAHAARDRRLFIDVVSDSLTLYLYPPGTGQWSWDSTSNNNAPASSFFEVSNDDIPLVKAGALGKLANFVGSNAVTDDYSSRYRVQSVHGQGGEFTDYNDFAAAWGDGTGQTLAAGAITQVVVQVKDSTNFNYQKCQHCAQECNICSGPTLEK